MPLRRAIHKMLYFVTGSRDKFAEAKAILPDIEQFEADLPEIQSIDAEEIARAKLEEAAKGREGAFFVEDTSLYLEALGGLPGPLIKWFMKTIGNEGLVTIAAAFDNTKATAKTIIGYRGEDGDVRFYEGSLEGSIVSPRGEHGFGWDAIFMPHGIAMTFAEMSNENKNENSMRQIALKKLKAALI